MVRDRPVLGYGSGSYAERYRERERVSSEKVAAASHTIPLTVTAEQGVIGLAAYLALVALSLALLFDGLRRTTIALAGRRGDRARGPRRRLLRAHPAHARVRGVPRGSAVVGAAGDRGGPARAPARRRRGARAGRATPALAATGS